MASLKIINAQVILPEQVIASGSVLVSDGIITEVQPGMIHSMTDSTIDAEGQYLSPGFIDIHVHGGGGADFMDSTEKAFLTVAETHARYGTTSMVPTTLTSTKEALLDLISVYPKALARNKSGARFIGLHIEGPYFAMSQRGAQDPRYIRLPDPNEYLDILAHARGTIARWSAAPELPGALEFGECMIANSVLPAIAHTDAGFEDVKNAREKGFSLATHFYSGMSGVTRKNAYRMAGVVESVYLFDDIDVEIIADGSHLPPALLQLIVKIKGVGHIALITDAMRAAGMPEGDSILGGIHGGIPVIVEDGVAKMPDRQSFAGSVATADRLVRTMLRSTQLPIHEVIAMMSLVPARIMRAENNTGSIARGKRADLVIFDEEINVSKTIIGGNLIER